MQVRYLTLPKATADSMGVKPGDLIMSEDAFRAAKQAVAEQRAIAERAEAKLALQQQEGRLFRASLDSIVASMDRIIAEKDQEIRRLNQQWDSLQRTQNARIEEVAIDLEIHAEHAETLKRESFRTDMESLRSAEQLKKQIKKSDQAVGEWLEKKKRSEKNKRTGFMRELLYHPTTTPIGRVLVGGMVVSFTALTVVTVISLTQ